MSAHSSMSSVKMLLWIAIALVAPSAQCLLIVDQQVPSKQLESLAHNAQTPNRTSTKFSLGNQKLDSLESISQRMAVLKFNSSIESNLTSWLSNTPNQTAIDFVILSDNHQVERRYNESPNSLNKRLCNSTSSLNNCSSANGTSVDELSSIDPLETSDSRLQLSRYDSQDYQEDSNNYANEVDSVNQEADNLIDEASSNLSEKKVVKELTRILSKSMSGATEQVRVETLENLKRRQQERKALKDNRAKLFEEILTTAINNHPERMKKSKEGKVKSRGTAAVASSAPSPTSELLSNTPEIDADLGSDAETILRSLHELATGSVEAKPSYTPQLVSESDASENSSSESGNEPSEVQEKSKKLAASNDRPIVRQFRRIKNQISQRRKQLDRIKKMFNIELALNPKDGSLVGNQVHQSVAPRRRPNKLLTPSSDQPEDSEEDTIHESKKWRSSPTPARSDKTRELMAYLSENPEILASVMAELTVDADPRSNSRARRSELSSSHQESDDNARPLYYRGRRPAKKLDQQVSDDTEEPDGIWMSPNRAGRNGDLRRSNELYSSLLSSVVKSRSSNLAGSSRATPADSDAQTSVSTTRPRTSTEELLLESLRERQLLNLARLDLVLAEKAAHNMSSNGFQSVSPTNPLSRSSMGSDSTYSTRRSSTDTNSAGSNSNFRTKLAAQSSNQAQSSGSKATEGLVSHFLTISDQNFDPIAKQRQLNQANNAEYLNSGSNHQQQYQQLIQGQPSQILNPNLTQANAINGGLNGHDLINLQQRQSLQHHGISLNPFRANEPSHQIGMSTVPAQQATLKRFQDWRDVSQDSFLLPYSRPGSMLHFNASLSPYDLTTTGYSSASSMGVKSYALQPRSLDAGSFQQTHQMKHEQSEPQSIGNSASSGNVQSNSLLDPQVQPKATQIRPGSIESDASTVTLAEDGNVKVNEQFGHRQRTTSQPDESKSSLKRDKEGGYRRSSRDEQESDRPPAQINDRVDYFKSYKDEEMLVSTKRRGEQGRSSNKLRKEREFDEQPPESGTSDPDLDDMGAMWA